jgi:hypothetical protein
MMMSVDKKQALNTENKRVSRAGDRQPTEGLRKSFKAVGFRYDLDQSTETYVVIHGYSWETLAKMSRGKPFARSERQLKSDVYLMAKYGVAKIERGDQFGNNQATRRITLYLDRAVPAEAIEARRAEWRATHPTKQPPGSPQSHANGSKVTPEGNHTRIEAKPVRDAWDTGDDGPDLDRIEEIASRWEARHGREG